MGNGRDFSWEEDFEIYSANQVESILEFLGVEVASETNTHFLAYCPFHGNSYTPAFAVDKEKGLWTCFNPSCTSSGTLEFLIRRLTKLNTFEAARLIIKHRNINQVPFEERLKEVLTTEPEFNSFPQEPLDRMYDEFWENDTPQEYMGRRHFDEETLRYFRIGYSAKQNMVIVPMHDPRGMPVGFIGRTASFDDKRFKNTENLPKSKTAWNFHRAKKEGESVVIVEASFDAMRVHQAGYPNVVALLGGYLSPNHLEQLNRTFSTIILMTDFDTPKFLSDGRCKLCNKKHNGCRPGVKLGKSIAQSIPNKKILWAVYDDECVFPNKPLDGYREGHAKDVGDMSDDEIRQCLMNAVSNFQFESWGISDRLLPWEQSRDTIDA